MEAKSEKDISAIIARRNTAIGLVFVLIGIGTILFRHLEHWSWIDSFYYIVVTSATVGYGDITPQTDTGKLVAALFIITIVPIILYSFTTIAEIYFERRVERNKIHSEKLQESKNK